MWFQTSNAYTKVVDANAEELYWLQQLLSFEDPRSRQRSWFAESVRLYLPDAGRIKFPTGLVSLIKTEAQQNGFVISIADIRKKPCEPDQNVDISFLDKRPFQRRAVDTSISSERGIIWAVTGAGKGTMAVALVQKLPCRWCFVVHSADISNMIADRYEELTGLKSGRIGDGHCSIERFTCATFAGLNCYRKTPEGKQYIQSIQALLVDEVHRLPAPTHYELVMSMENAFYRYGLSGTPIHREDKRDIFSTAALGPIIVRVKAEELYAAGIISKPKISLFPCHQPKSTKRERYQDIYDELVVRSDERNRLITRIVKDVAKKPILVFVTLKDHGYTLLKYFQQAGINSEFVSGNEKTAYRKNAIKRLMYGDIEALICTVIFQDGIDAPELKTVLNAGAGKTAIGALQRPGRGMRVSSGKYDETDGSYAFDMYDIYDTGNRWLRSHVMNRVAAYASEGYETIISEQVV